VAVALAARPPPGTSFDDAAVGELLSEIDVLLGAVKGLLKDASPEVKSSLEAIRNALVKEAVDFSEACHEVAAFESPATPAVVPGSGRATGSRLISVRTGESEPKATERKLGWLVWVVLALAVLGAGAFHGYRWWSLDRAMAELKTYPGQPDGMRLMPAPPGATTRELVPLRGPPDRAQVEKFKAQQRLLGYTITETSLGGLRIEPEAAKPPAGGGSATP
jgi:hypothetical protein